MPYSLRLLENGSECTLENGIIRALELVPDDSQQVSCVYPKTWYAWTDRTGITNPDVTGPYQLANLTPVSTADAGTLVITADGTIGSMTNSPEPEPLPMTQREEFMGRHNSAPQPTPPPRRCGSAGTSPGQTC